jgi:hypothetical protein
MVDASGNWYIDGIDLWIAFGMIIEKGSADLLALAPKKDSITHDWMDSNGIDVDLARVFFSEREIPLQLGILASSEEDYWAKRDAFFSQITQPGLHRLEIKAHGERSYHFYYKETNNYSQVSTLKGLPDSRQIGHKFTVVIVEPEPTLDSTTEFIIDEDGRFLVT